MFNRIKLALSLSKTIGNELVPKKEAIQTDSGHEVKKKSVMSVLQMCPLTKHDSECPIVGCTKVPCFIWEADKIVGRQKIERKWTTSKLKED